MSLWIGVTDACNGNPITDAIFGDAAGNVTFFNNGNGWYWVQIGQNTDYSCRDQANQYNQANCNTGTWAAESVNLSPKKSCGW